MSEPHEPIRRAPISFAHRGASARERENTMPAFELGLRLGASGLESDVWLTADGVPVLDHDGTVGPRLRRKPIASQRLCDLPAHVPTLDRLYSELGTDFELSLDVKDPAAIDAVVVVAKSHEQLSGRPVQSRLWLCYPQWQQLSEWRQVYADVKLVDSTSLSRMNHGPERRAAQLADSGIDTVNMHYNDWTGGLVVLFRRFRVLSFGWDAQHERMLDDLLRMGIDGLYSDHVERMSDAVARAGW